VRTADLIERLSMEGGYAPRDRTWVQLAVPLATGSAFSFAVMWFWLGIRPDLGAALATSAYWMKFAYTFVLAALAFWLVERLGRPGAAGLWPERLLSASLASITILAAIQFLMTPHGARMHLLMGASAMICPWFIGALSLPILIAAMVGLRRLAPTHLIYAGAAAGLLAGASGAWIYAFHCDESGVPFVAVWYSLGIAAVGALGGASGKWLLRW
jgi:hypothetical protein